MFDVAIIGAGVVGSLVARELTKYRLKIAVVDRENDCGTGASSANSGIVHAGFDAKPGSLKARFNVRGNELMPEVAKALGVKYVNNGSLVLAFNDRETETLDELYERGLKNGVPGLKILTKEEVLVMEPALSKDVTAALYAPTGGIICPYSLTIAALGCAMDNGAEFIRNFEVSEILKKTGFYRLKAPDGKFIEAKYVVNSAGLYSDKIAEISGTGDFRVHPRSGEYMLLDREFGNIVSKTIFQVPTKMGKGILVSPTAHGNLLLGPTSTDIEDKEDKRTTQDGLALVKAGASKSVPNLPLRGVITSFTGLRACGDTGDFIISIKDNFVNLGGIESPGLTSSPAIAEYVAELLKNNGLEFCLSENFRPGRDIKKAAPEKYNHIICRCETVSEGEIYEAVRSNPPALDIDGVKKRTRAGMGRCQGGFCQPLVAEIIARETGTDLLSITKSGKGSNILAGEIKGGNL